SESSMSVSSLKASMSSSVVSFAMVGVPSWLSAAGSRVGERADASGGVGGLLLAQGLDGARSLRGRRGEHVRSLVERCLERAGGLAQQHLAALEAGELVDIRCRQHPPLEHAALDDELGVVLGEVAQPLGGLDRLPAD